MDIDPQVQAATVSGIIGAVFGGGGMRWWSRKNTPAPVPNLTADRCEKICNIMVNSFEKLLTALEIVGEPEEVKHALRECRDNIAVAKSFLGIHPHMQPAPQAQGHE